MEPSWMLHAAMVFAVIGLFAAAWFRFNRPVRLKGGGGSRVEPDLERSQVTESVSTGGSESRREPRL